MGDNGGNNIILVSGLPRSGTSMMMKMLREGGVVLLTDNKRSPNIDNPGGFFELEKTKKLKEDTTWLAEALGKAIKILSQSVYFLPVDYHYKVIFMNRNMDEILASQRRMLIRRGSKDSSSNDDEMREIFERHLKELKSWIKSNNNFEMIDVSYNYLLEDSNSDEIHKLNNFLGGFLDEISMRKVIDSSLYRQRARVREIQ